MQFKTRKRIINLIEILFTYCIYIVYIVSHKLIANE